MKFSNFVSTLAVACLAFNADALRVSIKPTRKQEAAIEHFLQPVETGTLNES